MVRKKYTALDWAHKAGINGPDAVTAITPTIALYRMKNKMYCVERAGKLYWGLSGVTEEEVIERMREVAIKIMLPLLNISVDKKKGNNI